MSSGGVAFCDARRGDGPLTHRTPFCDVWATQQTARTACSPRLAGLSTENCALPLLLAARHNIYSGGRCNHAPAPEDRDWCAAHARLQQQESSGRKNALAESSELAA